MKNYICIQTFGCSANQNNSEILAGILTQAGYQITNNEEIAEIIILNTCVVKQKTENKIKRKIQDLERQDKLIIVTGCMIETDASSIKELNKNTIFLGTHHFKDILNLIKEYNENKLFWREQNKFLNSNNEIKLNLPKLPANKLISITQISEGCLGNCSYCKTRLANGKLYSYDIGEILNSIENDLKSGAKEVWITSQDNANYGMDKSIASQNTSLLNSSSKPPMSKKFQNSRGQQLPELLNKILNLNHRFKLRLGMMDPNNVLPILDRLIEVYKHPKIYKFLHIPIQSASNSVLKHMNRLYNIGQAEQIINKFRKQIPNITIATDIIAGYPTETSQDHEKNLNFIKKFKPDVFNLSKFSSHKQTKAGKLKTLNPDIIKKRTSELMSEHRKTALENKQKFLNKTISVFVNKKLGDNLFESRDDSYNIGIIKSKNKILGKNIDIRIKEVGVHHLIGEIIL